MSTEELLNWVITFLLDVACTFALYTLPIIIYRYAIRRRFVAKKTAKKVTVIYGIIAWIAMSVILINGGGKAAGPSIYLYSYINYRVLIAGWYEEDAVKAWFASITPQEAPAPADICSKPVEEAHISEAKQPQPSVQPMPKHINRKNKTAFCRLCGSPVNSETKKCSGCGKQYFRAPKIRNILVAASISVLLISLFGVSVFSIMLYKQNASLENSLQECNKTIASLEFQIKYMEYTDNSDQLEDTISLLRKELSAQQAAADTLLSFWNKHAAIVYDNNTNLYHQHQGCSQSKKNYDFWIYNIEQAKSIGYTPCPECYD